MIKFVILTEGLKRPASFETVQEFKVQRSFSYFSIAVFIMDFL